MPVLFLKNAPFGEKINALFCMIWIYYIQKGAYFYLIGNFSFPIK